MEKFESIFILIAIIALGINVGRLIVSSITILFGNLNLSIGSRIVNLLECGLLTFAFIILLINYY